MFPFFAVGLTVSETDDDIPLNKKNRPTIWRSKVSDQARELSQKPRYKNEEKKKGGETANAFYFVLMVSKKEAKKIQTYSTTICAQIPMTLTGPKNGYSYMSFFLPPGRPHSHHSYSS